MKRIILILELYSKYCNELTREEYDDFFNSKPDFTRSNIFYWKSWNVTLNANILLQFFEINLG